MTLPLLIKGGKFCTTPASPTLPCIAQFSSIARFISPVLTALIAGAIAVQGLQTCGSAEYDPSQYTCFNSSLLCPIVSGVKYQACGEDCYSTAEYTCFNGDFLCPYTSGGIATQACGDACYSPYEYSCPNGTNPFL
ncbi:carbohydrate binding-domain-containing protein [Mycena galopus ATCC 62051]|nr:carbohydrate binding-domain-containing protein [Mycena galopus ATCC 62051]